MALPAPRPLPARLAVPPGRLGQDLAAPELLLFSFQAAEAYETLRRDGVLRADPARAIPEFAEAYEWLRAQHAQRVAGSTGGPLLWAWARTTRQGLVEAAAEAARESPRPTVLLTCRVPRARVLLSEFFVWHHVLNRWPVTEHLPDEEAEAQSDAFVAARDRAGVDALPVTAWPPELRDPLLASWERIFDLSLGRSGVWQAAFEHLEAREVLDAVLLVRDGPGRGRGR